jgi:DNA polymerase III subunit gamma/tau
MAYLAMARKWRPKNFEEMVGQDHIAQTIRNAIEGKRISHAYLFTGTRGVGKTTSARILAKALNCGNGPTPIPCDICDNCKAVNAGNSMDVLEIDGASNNSVDNIRDLREQVKYAPMHGTYKIYVIDEVHMLSKSAFNALLKTLEEPPAHVIFIFATTEAGKLPHTILSRVQRFDFKRISELNIRERLEYICSKEAINPEREALEAIARKADGSMRDALSLFDQVYAFSGADLSLEAARKVLGLPRESLFDGLIASLIRHDQKACFSAIQEVHREGIETSDFLVAFGEYCRNLLFSRQGVSAVALGLSEARYAELSVLAPELRDGDIIRFAKMISDMLAQLKTAANPRLAIELGFARMASLDRVVTLSQVLGQELSSPMPTQPASGKPTLTPENTNSEEAKKKSLIETLRVSPPLHKPPQSLASKSPESATATITLSTLFADIQTNPDQALPEPVQDPSFTLEEDLDRQMETAYEIDSEEQELSEVPGFPKTVSELTQEEIEVPIQNAASLLPGLWPRLLGELISARPFLGTHLLRTSLECEKEEKSGLQIIFQEKTAYHLVGDNADFRKSIQSFLSSKVSGGAELQVRFVLNEVIAEKETKESVQLLYGFDDPMQVPIVGFIRDLFAGRQIN